MSVVQIRFTWRGMLTRSLYLAFGTANMEFSGSFPNVKCRFALRSSEHLLFEFWPNYGWTILEICSLANFKVGSCK